MKDFAITETRDFDRAAQRLQDLERYADRRDQLLEGLDFDSIGPNQLSSIFADEERTNEDLAWGHLYLDHLAGMKALSFTFCTDMGNAA